MSGGEAHEQRAASPGSHLMWEVRKACVSSKNCELKQELYLSGEITASTAPGPSPEDRVTHPSTAIALSLPHQEPLPRADNSALGAGWLQASCLTLLTSWFGISLRLQNPAQPGPVILVPSQPLGQTQALPACYLLH